MASSMTKRLNSKVRVKAFDKLYNKFRKQELSCNLPIRCGGMVLRIHSCVARSIPFFAEMDILEDADEINFLPIVDLPAKYKDNLEPLFRYVYTGKVVLSISRATQVLKLATYLKMHDTLVKEILDWLFLQVPTLENISSLLRLCNKLRLEHPGMENLQLMYDGQLPELLEGSYLYHVDRSTLVRFMQSEKYNYTPRGKIANFVLRWVNCDLRRRVSLPELCQFLGLNNLDEKDLDRFLREPLFKKFPETLKAIAEAKWACKDKKEEEMCDAIVLVGGTANFDDDPAYSYISYSSTTNVWAYVQGKNKWFAQKKLPEPVPQPSACTDGNGTIFCTNRQECPSGKMKLYSYNPQEAEEWAIQTLSFAPEYRHISVKQLVYSQEQLFVVVFAEREGDHRLELNPNKALVFQVQSEMVYASIIQKVYDESKIKVHNFDTHSIICIADKREATAYLANATFDHIQPLPKWMGKEFNYGFLCTDEDNLLHYCPGRKVNIYRAGSRGLNRYSASDMGQYPVEPAPKSMMFSSFFGDLVLGGGYDGSNNAGICSIYHFQYDKKEWVQLPDLPHGIMWPAMLRVKLSPKLVACCHNCPHCLVRTLPTEVIYDTSTTPGVEIWD